MSGASRRKGVRGEREVADVWQRYGFEVRGLEGSGDHLAIGYGLTIHSESKRHETARVWRWYEQAERETPLGALTVVSFRRSRSPWLSLIPLEQLATSLVRLKES